MEYTARQLASAVSAICPDIQAVLEVNKKEARHDESDLWQELCSCILSSQVPYELAVQYGRAIAQSEILSRRPSGDDMATALEVVLRTPVSLVSGPRLYRFPASKAAQIAKTYRTVLATSGSLHSLLLAFNSPQEGRAWFALNACGLGPKQASMFLRNVGLSYDLAVLDRHVLSYMRTQRLITRDATVAHLEPYARVERKLIRHARDLGQLVGHLDWAIWIVMRVAVGSQRGHIT
jgi:N-glycosylase/DNA lyase